MARRSIPAPMKFTQAPLVDNMRTFSPTQQGIEAPTRETVAQTRPAPVPQLPDHILRGDQFRSGLKGGLQSPGQASAPTAPQAGYRNEVQQQQAPQETNILDDIGGALEELFKNIFGGGDAQAATAQQQAPTLSLAPVKQQPLEAARPTTPTPLTPAPSQSSAQPMPEMSDDLFDSYAPTQPQQVSPLGAVMANAFDPSSMFGGQMQQGPASSFQLPEELSAGATGRGGFGAGGIEGFANY